MRWLPGFLWFLYKIALFYTVLVYALAYWSLSSHWITGFMMLSLPLLFVFHLVFLLVWAALAPRRIPYTLLILALGFPFLSRTFQWNSADAPAAPPRLKVMNYNVLRFNMHDYESGKNKSNTEQMRTWLAQQDADVICFQEFYHYAHGKGLNFTSLLRKAGYKYHVSQTLHNRASSDYELGLAVYSRYPVIAKKDTFFGGQNGLLQADILWQKDTVRVIDVHLYSMTLKLGQLARQKELEGVKRETRGTLRQMRRGYVNRAEEVGLLESWIRETPTNRPIIVCGDFNETPYSYVYGRMNSLLTNAFEVKGRGFGFTFNQLPYFIRIDHQFYTANHLELHNFDVLNKIPYSDHYPVVA
ncbi:MAG: endonuclease/exonuclease/phosphatase family protein, partial [Bacteroidetes bacterium]|nr:endonuclease/exonuclease/phosphatase family protein [Bacteroidota bacterium]